METTRLISSWGVIEIETSTGAILQFDKECEDEPCYIDYINKFDVAEFNNWFFRRYGFQPNLSELDILDLNFILEDGTHSTPSTWRYDIRRELEESGKLKVYNNI
jgi:hypothetical protein